MPSATLTKRFTFESAHHLPNHRGKCARPHGHSYTLEVAVRGRLIAVAGASDEGMVIDLDNIRATVTAQVIERLDHQDLNTILAIRTTAENLAHWIWQTLEPAFDGKLYRIRLWETATGYVEVTADDR